MNKTSLVVLASMMCLSACATSKPASKAQIEDFTTNISENGTKSFVYRLSHSKKGNNGASSVGKGGRRGTGGRNGSRRSASRNTGSMDNDARSDVLIETAIDRLTLKLEETGYCKQGFIELGRSVDKQSISVRGECNDGATDEDRDKFKNS